jgi:drug/metabolite transporter (DMT)-like permease
MTLWATYLLAALAAILWGANFNLSKPVVAELHPFFAGASRFVIAALLMLAITTLKGQRVPLRHAKIYALLGLVGIGGFNLLFFFGMQSTSAVNGALIMALNPLLTALLAYAILGERPNQRQLLAFPAGVVGVGILILGNGAHVQPARGDILMLAANLSWAFYNVLIRKFMPADTGGLANTAGVMVAGALILTFVATVTGTPVTIPSWHAGSALLVMAIGGSVLAYLFWNIGIGKLGPTRAAPFLNLVPVSSMVIASLTGTPPSFPQILGGVLVIGTVMLASLPMRKTRDRASELGIAK